MASHRDPAKAEKQFHLAEGIFILKIIFDFIPSPVVRQLVEHHYNYPKKFFVMNSSYSLSKDNESYFKYQVVC